MSASEPPKPESDPERLRTLFEHAFEFIGLLTPDGVLLELNRGALVFAGVRREEVLGKPLWSAPWWRHAPEPEWLERAIQEAAEGRFVRHEMEVRSASGRLAVIDFSLTPVLEQERVVYLVSEGRDITERKRAETERQRTEEGHLLLLQAGELLARTLDFEATLQQVAGLLVPQHADCCIIHLLGPGDSVEVAALVHVEPARARGLHKLYQRYPVRLDAPHGAGHVIRTGQPQHYPKVEQRVRDDLALDPEHLELMQAVSFTSALIVPLRGRERVLGSISLNMSSSVRSLGERDLAFAGELAHLAALALENAKLYHTAQQATRSRDEVMGIVAHDLRAPLTTLSMSAQLIERQLERGKAGADTQEMVRLIQRMAQRMGRLVE
ncbi:MAG: PAS domain S-box protein, partial [Archangium sp.]